MKQALHVETMSLQAAGVGGWPRCPTAKHAVERLYTSPLSTKHVVMTTPDCKARHAQNKRPSLLAARSEAGLEHNCHCDLLIDVLCETTLPVATGGAMQQFRVGTLIGGCLLTCVLKCTYASWKHSKITVRCLSIAA